MSFKSAVLTAISSPRHKEIETPWGKVRIVSLLGRDYDRLAEKRARAKSAIRDSALIVIATCFDPETNQPCFTDDDLDDLCSGRADIVRYLAEHANIVNSVEPLEDAEGKETTAG